jgi:hypothetical protein
VIAIHTNTTYEVVVVVVAWKKGRLGSLRAKRLIGSTAWGTIEFALCAEEGRTKKENLLLIVELKRKWFVAPLSISQSFMLGGGDSTSSMGTMFALWHSLT